MEQIASSAHYHCFLHYSLSSAGLRCQAAWRHAGSFFHGAQFEIGINIRMAASTPIDVQFRHIALDWRGSVMS